MTAPSKEDELKVFGLLVAALEHDLRLPKGTVKSLSNDDDWTMVVKGAAILEAALADTIRRLLGHEQLGAIGQAWEDGLGGKLKVAKRYGLLNRLQVDAAYELKALRNLCAHDRAALWFTFDQHLEQPAARLRYERIFYRLAWTPEDEAKLNSEPPAELPRPATPGVALLIFVFTTCIHLLTKKATPATGVH